MSKKQQKKAKQPSVVAKPIEDVIPQNHTPRFGFDEMLGELEAIITEAEVRLAQEAHLA